MKDYTIYLSEDLAKKAMEKGFEIQRETLGLPSNVPSFYLEPSKEDRVWNNSWGCYCPTAEQVCGWLREEHKIFVSISQKFSGDYPYYGYTYKMSHSEYAKTNSGFSYEEVMLGIIGEALNLI